MYFCYCSVAAGNSGCTTGRKHPQERIELQSGKRARGGAPRKLEHGAENSVAAIDSAIRMKVDIVEIDVSKTKDGQLVLMHDATVDRTTDGKGQGGGHDAGRNQAAPPERQGREGDRTHRPHSRRSVAGGQRQGHAQSGQGIRHLRRGICPAGENRTTDLVIMKGDRPGKTVKKEFGAYLDKVIYMPIVTIDEEKSIKTVKDYIGTLHPAAFEFCYMNPSSPVPVRMKQVLKRKEPRMVQRNMPLGEDGGRTR